MIRGKSHTIPYIQLRKRQNEVDVRRTFLGEEGNRTVIWSHDGVLARRVYMANFLQETNPAQSQRLLDFSEEDVVKGIASVLLINSATPEEKAQINYFKLNKITGRVVRKIS